MSVVFTGSHSRLAHVVVPHEDVFGDHVHGRLCGRADPALAGKIVASLQRFGVRQHDLVTPHQRPYIPGGKELADLLQVLGEKIVTGSFPREC